MNKKPAKPIPKKSNRPKIKLISSRGPVDDTEEEEIEPVVKEKPVGLKQSTGLKRSSSALRKSKTRIKTTSFQAERNNIYKGLKDIHLANHRVCEICNRKEAVSLHHRAYRKGYNLYRLYMGLCWKCHTWVHENQKISKEIGFLLDVDPRLEDLDETDEIYQIKPNNIGNTIT